MNSKIKDNSINIERINEKLAPNFFIYTAKENGKHFLEIRETSRPTCVYKRLRSQMSLNDLHIALDMFLYAIEFKKGV